MYIYIYIHTYIHIYTYIYLIYLIHVINISPHNSSTTKIVRHVH